MNSKPNYQKIDAEAFAARDAAERAAAADGWTGWDCTKRGLDAVRKIWRAAGVASPEYRDPIPDDGLDTLDIDALDA